jgi:hypothetical protein
MPRKQATVNESSAAAAPARAAKPKAPRVKSAKHTKAAAIDSAAVPETNSAIQTAFAVSPEASATQPAPVLDSAAVADALQAELPVEQIETSLFVPVSVPEGAPVESVAAPVAADPREEIARIAYSYWQARGCVGGDPLEDWVRAENEYRQRLS